MLIADLLRKVPKSGYQGCKAYLKIPEGDGYAAALVNFRIIVNDLCESLRTQFGVRISILIIHILEHFG